MQRRVRTTMRPDDVLTVEDGDFASLEGQGLILEVLAGEPEGDDETPPAPPEPPVEVPAQSTAKTRGKEAGDGQ